MSPLIVHTHFHGRRTGVTRHVEDLVRAFAGFEGDDAVEAKALGWGLERPLPSIDGLTLWRRRRESLVWHAHRNHELIAGLLWRGLRRLLFGRSCARLSLVFTRHAASPASGLTRWVASRADRVVALTREMAGSLDVPSTVVGHGVDLRRFRPPEDRAAAFEKLGLGGRFGVGVIGRIRPDKGQGDFTEAIAPLLSRYPDWRGVLAGKAKRGDRAWLRGLLAKAALAHVGEQEDIAAWYQGLTVLVQPSHEESFSLVLLEAMAAGCCVVAARMPHYPLLIDDGRTGFIYPPGDVGALRERLSELMADPGRARAVGAAAAEEARARFGIEHEAKALRSLYRALD